MFVERIKTSKGNYSLTLGMLDNQTSMITLSDSKTEISMMLDEVDLRRIGLLISDHIPTNNKEKE